MTGQLADLLSFWRIADIPFGAYLAAPDSCQLTGHHDELRLGHSLLRGPMERDQPFDTTSPEAWRWTTSPRCTGKPRGLVADHIYQVQEGS